MLRTRSSWRRLKIRIRSTVEDGVEGATELRITVVNQQPPLAAIIVEVHQQVARLLQHPGAVRVARTRNVLDPAAADANEHEHIQSPQQNGVDGEKVAGERRRRVCSEERTPVQPATLGCRRNARCLEQVARQGG